VCGADAQLHRKCRLAHPPCGAPRLQPLPKFFSSSDKASLASGRSLFARGGQYGCESGYESWCVICYSAGRPHCHAPTIAEKIRSAWLVAGNRPKVHNPLAPPGSAPSFGLSRGREPERNG
jgi:hypothetical protein